MSKRKKYAPVAEWVELYPDAREMFVALCSARHHLQYKKKYPPYAFTRMKKKMIREGYLKDRFYPTEKGVKLFTKLCRQT
ncbi:MAG: hypothetical protein KatS3mg031_2846 [Chitinophagales bacterium]|nr:MAG: hypothetical protein KatS3mg031_2846 [Chitinophagales bacterium]